MMFDVMKSFAKKKFNMFRHSSCVYEICKIVCGTYSKPFKDSYELRQHVKSIHEDSKLLCEFYSSAFNTRQSLRRHRIMVHSNNPPLLCEMCGQKFLKSEAIMVISTSMWTKSATMNIFRNFLFSFKIICKSRIKLRFHKTSVHYS